MAIQRWIVGRDPSRIVIWLDDQMFNGGERSILLNSFAPGQGDFKGSLLFALRQGTCYGLLISDEAEVEERCIFDYPTPATPSSNAGMVARIKREIVNEIGKVRRLHWILDVVDAREDERGTRLKRFRQQFPAVLSMLAEEDRDWRMSIVSQLPAGKLEQEVSAPLSRYAAVFRERADVFREDNVHEILLRVISHLG